MSPQDPGSSGGASRRCPFGARSIYLLPGGCRAPASSLPPASCPRPARLRGGQVWGEPPNSEPVSSSSERGVWIACPSVAFLLPLVLSIHLCSAWESPAPPQVLPAPGSVACLPARQEWAFLKPHTVLPCHLGEGPRAVFSDLGACSCSLYRPRAIRGLFRGTPIPSFCARGFCLEGRT